MPDALFYVVKTKTDCIFCFFQSLIDRNYEKFYFKNINIDMF
jgi:hypothetical protein